MSHDSHGRSTTGQGIELTDSPPTRAAATAPSREGPQMTSASAQSAEQASLHSRPLSLRLTEETEEQRLRRDQLDRSWGSVIRVVFDGPLRNRERAKDEYFSRIADYELRQKLRTNDDSVFDRIASTARASEDQDAAISILQYIAEEQKAQLRHQGQDTTKAIAAFGAALTLTGLFTAYQVGVMISQIRADTDA